MSEPNRRRARVNRAQRNRTQPPVVVVPSGNDRSDVAVEIVARWIAEHRARERG